MKKLLFTSMLAAAFPAFAEPASCTEYYEKMEETLKKEGNYSEEAMKLIQGQIAEIPGDQKDAFCKAGLEGLQSQTQSGAAGKNNA